MAIAPSARMLWRRAIVLARYTWAGILAFLFELALLAYLVNNVHFPPYLSVAMAFIISTVFQYGLCHWWVFTRSRRRVGIEFTYFFVILISGLFLTLLVVRFFLFFGLGIIAARAISGIFTGLWDFYLNARFNFRVHAFLRHLHKRA